MIKIRNLAVAAGAAAVALVMAVPGTASAADQALVIDSYDDWNGSDYVYPFGQPNTSTYGQTITSPEGRKKAQSFSFWMAPNTGAGDIVMRGAIYAWDGDSATGSPIWESKKGKAFSFDVADPTYQKVTFKTKKAKKMTPGQQYVVFASISKDYEASDPNVLNQWAANYTDVLPGGDVVYINDAGDESQWTGGTWSMIPGYDFALQVNMK